METVERWSGRETRLLRHALRLTVRGFAEDLGVCVRTVSKWEALGPALIPRPELQAALDTMLRLARDEDRERFRVSTVPARAATPLPVDAEQVAVAVLSPLLGLLAAIGHQAGEAPTALRHDLLTLGADGAGLAARLYRDGHDLARAQYWQDRAGQWAQEAGAAMPGW